MAVGLTAAPARAQPGAATTAPESNGKATVSKPLWGTLTTEQQAALKPLALHWNNISPLQKSKWLAISRNFASMTPEEQATLHSRMNEWAALSAQQRALARLNFADVMRLPVDERKAKWEAYQALSEEEKRDLAERALRSSSRAPLPVRPVPEKKLAPVPPATAMLGKGEHGPRIQLWRLPRRPRQLPSARHNRRCPRPDACRAASRPGAGARASDPGRHPNTTCR